MGAPRLSTSSRRVNFDLTEWANYNLEWIYHKDGWPSENILCNPDTKGGRFGSNPLMRDIPRRIRRIDLIVSRLPPPYPDILKAKYWFYRWPEGHPRAGMEIYDSDRGVWFGFGGGWFKNRVRTAKRLYKQGLLMTP